MQEFAPANSYKTYGVDGIEKFLKYSIQRSLLLSYLMQMPYNDIYSSGENVDVLNGKMEPNFRTRYKDNYFSNICNDLPYINDLMYLFPPPNCELRMSIQKINPLDTEIVRVREGITSESSYDFYEISLISSENSKSSGSLTFECPDVVYTPKLYKKLDNVIDIGKRIVNIEIQVHVMM